MDTDAPTQPDEDMKSSGHRPHQSRKSAIPLHTDVNYEKHGIERDTSVHDKAVHRDIRTNERDAVRAASETAETEDDNDGIHTQ
jgi:hypothetical protein